MGGNPPVPQPCRPGQVLTAKVFCSHSDPSTRSWPPGGRTEGGEEEEEEEDSFPQLVDDYFVEPPQAEEGDEDVVSLPSSHAPAVVSKGEAVSGSPVLPTQEQGWFGESLEIRHL